jgi:hypothetical protein
VLYRLPFRLINKIRTQINKGAIVDDELMTDEEVAALTKGRVSKSTLAQRRFKGLPPAFIKPTPRAVLYRRSAVEAWIADSERFSTADA